MNPQDLKAIRTSLRLTQSEFAAMLGYSRTATIADKENGKAVITTQDKIICGFYRLLVRTIPII